MKMLITGGLGFLGRALTLRLLKDGHDVTVIDNRSSSVVGPGYFSGWSRFRFFPADLASFRLPASPWDMIFHLAGPVGTVGVLPYNGILGKTIIEQTHHILDWCCESQARCIFISTSEVYGQDGAMDEEDCCVVPTRNTTRLEYGLGKRLAEAMVANRLGDAGIPYQIIRPFNIAGPFQNHRTGFVIPTLFRQALANQPLTVFGNGQQRRAFGHVDDIVDGIVKAALYPQTNLVFNLGVPENLTTINALAEKILAITQSNSSVTHLDPKSCHGHLFTDTYEKLPNPKLARRVLGWKPQYSMDSLLEEVFHHLQSKQVLLC